MEPGTEPEHEPGTGNVEGRTRAYSSSLPLCLRLRHGRLLLSSCAPPVWRGSGARGLGGRLRLGRGEGMGLTVLL